MNEEFLLPVLLNAGSAESSKAITIERRLPRKEFVNCKHITGASFLHGKQATAYSGNYLSLSSNYPTLCTLRRQIR